MWCRSSAVILEAKPPSIRQFSRITAADDRFSTIIYRSHACRRLKVLETECHECRIGRRGASQPFTVGIYAVAAVNYSPNVARRQPLSVDTQSPMLAGHKRAIRRRDAGEAGIAYSFGRTPSAPVNDGNVVATDKATNAVRPPGRQIGRCCQHAPDRRPAMTSVVSTAK